MESSLYMKVFERQVNELLDSQNIASPRALMHESYVSATDALQSIISASEKWYRDNESDKKNFYGYGSNVIAFCGARGQGKTSAMLSFSHALENGNGEKLELPLSSIPKDSKFFVLSPIDPTLLAPHESVINLIITSLFRQMEDNWRDACQNMTPENSQRHTELLKDFQKCRDCLARQINDSKKQDLSDFMQSSNILEVRKYLYHILSEYFRMKNASGQNSYLIIQLDDTDMDMVNAYNVLEDIRKYLALPQTVVLMATYLRQLRILVAKHFEDALRLKEDDPYPVADYMQMAAQYIDKLIPAPQMIHLSPFRYRKDLNGKIKIGDFEEDHKDKDKDFEKALFKLIEEKTGLIFLSHRTYVNNILPTTLRGLSHLYRLLRKMESPERIPRATAFSSPQERLQMLKSYRASLELYQRNLVVFEDYFRNDWCYSNLDSRDQEILWKISQTHVAPKLRIIMNLLKERFEKKKVGVLKDNISFLDLVMYLQDREDMASGMSDLLLIFAVRVHISIQLNKLILAEKLYDLRSRIQTDKENLEAEADRGVRVPLEYEQIWYFLNCGRELQENDKSKKLNDLCSSFLSKTGRHANSKNLAQYYTNQIVFLYHVGFLKFVEANMPLNSIAASGSSQESNETGNKATGKTTIAAPELEPNLLKANLQDAAFRILANPDILRLFLIDGSEKSKEYNGVIYNDQEELDDPDLGNLNGVKQYIEEITLRSLPPKTTTKTTNTTSESDKFIDLLSNGASDTI